MPVALFWADNDWLADVDDVQFLIKNLPNLVYNQKIDNWDHIDFIWAIDAHQIIYNNMMELMLKYMKN